MKKVAFMLLCIALAVITALLCPGKVKIVTEDRLVPVTQIEVVPEVSIGDYVNPNADRDAVDALSKMVYGEARGCSKMKQAATVWCVLNRVDANGKGILASVVATGQFYGYSPDNPVLPEIRALVLDVLIRWQAEKNCVGNIGRVLPREYLYFTGDGVRNYFRTEHNGGKTWDWSLPDPYAG